MGFRPFVLPSLGSSSRASSAIVMCSGFAQGISLTSLTRRVSSSEVIADFSRSARSAAASVSDCSLLTATRGVVMDGEGTIDRVTLSAPSQNIVSINIQGRESHAGLEPEKGLSALVIAGQVLTRLPLGRIDEETTSNIGRAEGGLKRNIIPETAYLDGEIRSRNNNKLEEISKIFRDVCKQVESEFPQSQISLEIRNSYKIHRISTSI